MELPYLISGRHVVFALFGLVLSGFCKDTLVGWVVFRTLLLYRHHVKAACARILSCNSPEEASVCVYCLGTELQTRGWLRGNVSLVQTPLRGLDLQTQWTKTLRTFEHINSCRIISLEEQTRTEEQLGVTGHELNSLSHINLYLFNQLLSEGRQSAATSV